MEKSFKIVWAITLVSKDKKNEITLKNKDLFLDELKKFFENNNVNYVIEELPQTLLEEKKETYSFLLCYDTTCKNVFRAIDLNLKIKNKVANLLYNIMYDKCHYIICDDDLMNDKYIELILHSYNTKYSTILEKNEFFGFI